MYESYTWPELEEKWVKCQAFRKTFIDENRENPLLIFNKWPPYKAPLGYRLIEMDFNFLYPDAESILNKWHDFECNIKTILTKELKKPHEIQYLAELNLATSESK